MVTYFQKFPAILYSADGSLSETIVTNIVHRARLRKVLENNTAIYYEYVVKETDTPETIAYKYYGNANYHWVVMLVNNMVNPYYDWPITYQDFQETMIKMYGDIRTAKITTLKYYDIYSIEIDKTTYDATADDERSLISAYDFYYNLNESKRNIKLLDKTYLPRIDDELTTLLSHAI